MGVRSWWSDISKQKAPVTNSLARAKSGTVSQFSQFDVLVPWWARYNEELFVREAYRTNALVRECIEYRCRSVSLATMYAYRSGDTGDVKLSEGHWIQRLLRRPSNLYPTQTRWMRQIERQMNITGECFIYLARKGRGKVGETQILPGQAIQVIPGKTGIRRYDYRPNGQTEPIPIQPEEMIFLRYDDPMDPLRGCSPLASAWREIQSDNSMGDYRKAFFDNAAIPGGVLTTNLPANADQLRQWSEDFTDKFSGPKKAGKTPALAGGLEYQRAGANPREVDFGQIGAIPETRVCMAFGVHPILIAAKIGLEQSTYSNFKEAHSAFWEDTIVPEMELISDEFTVGLTQLGDPNFCGFDTSRVPALQPDKEKVQNIAKDGLINGAITVNEYRKRIGENPVSDGDVYYRPAGFQVVPDGELDVKPPDAIEIAEATAKLGAQGGKEDQGGRPANDEKDQDKAPKEGSANDRSLPEHIPDRRLLEIVQELHADQRALLEGPIWDRALYVARVSGTVRSRLARMARTGQPQEELDPEELADWLDHVTIEMGNALADFAQRGDKPEKLHALVGIYTTKALQAFSEATDKERA